MKIQNVKSLPEVLTIEQVHQIIDCCTTHQHRTFVFPADGRNHRGVSHRKGPSQATTPMSPTAMQGAVPVK